MAIYFLWLQSVEFSLVFGLRTEECNLFPGQLSVQSIRAVHTKQKLVSASIKHAAAVFE